MRPIGAADSSGSARIAVPRGAAVFPAEHDVGTPRRAQRRAGGGLRSCLPAGARERGQEVDFVVRAGRAPTAIEVKGGRTRDARSGLAAFGEAPVLGLIWSRPTHQLAISRPRKPAFGHPRAIPLH
jgi:hypothetical protein